MKTQISKNKDHIKRRKNPITYDGKLYVRIGKKYIFS